VEWAQAKLKEAEARVSRARKKVDDIRDAEAKDRAELADLRAARANAEELKELIATFKARIDTECPENEAGRSGECAALASTIASLEAVLKRRASRIEKLADDLKNQPEKLRNAVTELTKAEREYRDVELRLKDTRGRATVTASTVAGALQSVRAFKETLQATRRALMMRDDSVEAGSIEDAIEHYSAEFAVHFGRLHQQHEALVLRLDVDRPFSYPEQPESDGGAPSPYGPKLEAAWTRVAQAELLRELGLSSEGRDASRSAPRRLMKSDVVPMLDRCVLKLSRYESQLESLEALWSAYQDRPRASGSLHKIKSGDLMVFRFNVRRGIVSTTAYLLANDEVEMMFGTTFAKTFYVAQVTLRNPNDKPIIVYGNTMKLLVRMNAEDSRSLREDGRPQRFTWWATYEPVSYSAVLATLDGQQAKSWQQSGIDAAELAGLIGSIGSVFTTALDYNRGVAVFSSAFAPWFRDLMERDLRRHRQNFLKFALPEQMEIEAGAASTRHVFLPKGPIYGDFFFDLEEAAVLPGRARDARSAEFGARALRPTYIHNIRRDTVFIEGKRILESDPLSSVGGG